MTEKGSADANRISLDKTADHAVATGAAEGGPAAGDPATPQRPKQATWVVVALVLTGLLAVGASLSLYGLHSFIYHQLTVANGKLKASDRRSTADLLKSAHQQPTASLIQSAIFLVVLVAIARAVWRGRYWARWAVIGIWILASFTGIFGGAFQILYIAQSAPLALKLPITLSSVSFIVAVALVGFVKPVGAWLNLTRPERRPASSSAAKRGRFAQRDPVRASRQGLSTTSLVGSRKVRETASRTEDLFRGDANTERARAKQRATTETMQRGAAEARARARGSKSRRSGS